MYYSNYNPFYIRNRNYYNRNIYNTYSPNTLNNNEKNEEKPIHYICYKFKKLIALLFVVSSKYRRANSSPLHDFCWHTLLFSIFLIILSFLKHSYLNL